MTYLNTTIRDQFLIDPDLLLDADHGSSIRPYLYVVLFVTLITVSLKSTIFASQPKGNELVDAPIIGPSNFLSHWFFFKNARDYIAEGYQKVRMIGWI